MSTKTDRMRYLIRLYWRQCQRQNELAAKRILEKIKTEFRWDCDLACVMQKQVFTTLEGINGYTGWYQSEKTQYWYQSEGIQ